MMKIKNIFLGTLALASLSACKDGMDYREVDDSIDYEYITEHWNKVAGLLVPMYDAMDYDFGNQLGKGPLMAAACDEAWYAVPGSEADAFFNGAWSPTNAKNHIWTNAWKGISYANHYLDNFLGLKFDDYLLDKGYAQYYSRYKNEEFEVRFMRAYFYFTLVRQYGGVPLKVSDLSASESTALPRVSADEIFAFIDSECEAIKGKIRKDYGDLGTLATNNIENGRANDIAVMALQARAAMYHASPLFNPENDVARWQKAAELTKALLDECESRGMTLLKGDMATVFENLYGSDSFKNGVKEIIWARRCAADNAMEKYNFPSGMIKAGGGNCPTQNLVDAYDMVNGKSIDDAASGYDPQNPYANRDPRLYATVAINGDEWPADNKNKVLETFIGGLNGLNNAQVKNATKTGYYLKKYLNQKQIINGTTSVAESKSAHAWVTFRLAEFYLNYAECLFNVSGVTDEAVAAINKVRERAGVGALPNSMTADEFKVRYQKERMVELAFEGHRFYDVRRWKQGKELETLKVMQITKNDDGTFSYEVKEDNSRKGSWNDKMYLFPIPQSDVMKGGLKQNPGW